MRACALILALVLALVLLSCGRAPKIQLKTEIPNAPSKPVPKPGDGIDPSGGDEPAKQIGYRVFCESSEGQDSVLSSGRWGAASSVTRVLISVFERGNQVAAIRNLVPLENFKHYRGRFLFEGETLIRGHERSERQIYLGWIDVAHREGQADVVSRAVEPDANAAALAARLNLKLRNFGVSSRGTWVIVPYGKKLALIDTRDLSLAAVLELQANQTFYPTFDEDSGRLSYLGFKEGRFVNELVKLAVGTSRPLTAVQVLEMPAPPANWTAMPMENGENVYVWAERPIVKPESAVAMVVGEVGKSVRRFVHQAGAQSLRIGLKTAFQRLATGETALVAAIEPISSGTAGGRLVLLTPSSGVFSVAKEWAYPTTGLTVVELTASRDHLNWIGSFKDSKGHHALFRAEEALVQNGSGDCRSPVLIAEEY